jgi:citrate lyase beta subunit
VPGEPATPIDAAFPPRCVLFFPATRPDRYAKALATGADRVCMDLEDAVAADAKDEARANAVATVGGGADTSRLIVRINHPSTSDGEDDLVALERALADGAAGPAAVMIPKVGAAGEVGLVRSRLGAEVPLVAMIETARGLAAAEEIAGADGVASVLFGGVDLSSELGCSTEWDALLYARSRVVHAAALGHVGAIDFPWLDAADAGGLLEESTRVRALGFRGKAAIHPSQVATIQGVFWPTASEVQRARRIVEAAEASAEGVFLLAGVMVDRPVVEAARRVLAVAEAGS